MLRQETLKYLRKMCAEYGVKKMILYGSCLHKPEEEANDIDLAIDGIEEFTTLGFAGKLLRAKELDKPVDVINLSSKNLFNSVREIILDEGMIIYEGEV